MKTEKTLTYADLAQFSGGSDERYRHERYVIYTAGVRFLAEQAGAYWLIDAIASHYKYGPKNVTREFWRLEVCSDSAAVLYCRDESSDIPFYYWRRIRGVEFPLDCVDVWAGFDGKDWTLYLPCEY